MHAHVRVTIFVSESGLEGRTGSVGLEKPTVMEVVADCHL